MENNKTKSQFEAEYIELCDEAEKFVLSEIQRICKKNKWSFKTVYGCTVYSDKDGINAMLEEEIQDTEVHKLVHWYEHRFGRFGMYAFTKGKWLEGQTPLIVFKKPVCLL